MFNMALYTPLTLILWLNLQLHLITEIRRIYLDALTLISRERITLDINGIKPKLRGRISLQYGCSYSKFCNS